MILHCYSYGLPIHTRLQWHYVMMLHYMSVPTFRIEVVDQGLYQYTKDPCEYQYVIKELLVSFADNHVNHVIAVNWNQFTVDSLAVSPITTKYQALNYDPSTYVRKKSDLRKPYYN